MNGHDQQSMLRQISDQALVEVYLIAYAKTFGHFLSFNFFRLPFRVGRYVHLIAPIQVSVLHKGYGHKKIHTRYPVFSKTT